MHLFDSRTESVPKAGPPHFQVPIQDLKRSAAVFRCSLVAFLVYACRLCMLAKFICASLYCVCTKTVFVMHSARATYGCFYRQCVNRELSVNVNIHL